MSAAAVSAKPSIPKFGGGGEKCKTCEKTVYPQERISYDNGTWHQLCFKCQSCKSTLSLTAVAMINGDLYCKTCFKKIFMREGKYSSFEAHKTQTLPKDFKEGTASSPPPSSSPPPPESIARSPSPSFSAQRSPSPSITSPSGPPTPLSSLQSAIERKDLSSIHSILDEGGVSLLFQPVKVGGATVLEWALTSYMHRVMGGKLLEWMEERVEKANKTLEEAGAPVNPLKGTKVGKDDSSSTSKQRSEESKEATESTTSAQQ